MKINIGKIFNKKNINIATFIIYSFNVLIFEILYCNSTFIRSLISNGTFNNYNFSLYRLIMYLIPVLIYINFVKNNILDEIVETFKHKSKLIIVAIYLVYALITIIMFIAYIKNHDIVYKRVAIMFITIFNGLLSIIYISNNMIKNFISISLTLGIMFTFATNLNHVIDEGRHFMSSYNLSTGNINYRDPIVDSKLNSIAQNIPYYSIDKYFGDKYSSNVYEENNIKNCALLPAMYNPILYIPSALGISMAKLMHGSVADLYFSGRIFNLIAYIILATLALKTIPFKKNIFMVIFLLPLSLCLSATYSVDGICLAICLNFIAYCLKIYDQKEIKNYKQFFIIIFLFELLVLLKSMSYILLGMLIFTLPIKRFFKKNEKSMSIFIVSFIIIIAIGFLCTYFQNKGIVSDTRVENTNATEQVKNLIKNPSIILPLVFNHIDKTIFSMHWLYSFNSPLLFFRVSIIEFYFIFAFVILVAIRDKSIDFSVKNKLIYLIIFNMVYIFTSFMLYVSFTPVGSSFIKGYQPRYLLPILPLLLFIFTPNKINFKILKNESMYISFVSIILLIISIYGAAFGPILVV